jgi:nitrogen fixation protein FixH
MKRLTMALTLAAPLLVTACGGGNQQPDITFTSEPDPPRMGENAFEVMVMQDGQPVTDADVSVEFFMPAMPAMNMAEMKNTVTLKHEGAGRYRGTGNVMMAGDWDATVMAMRGGQELASRKLRVVAK